MTRKSKELNPFETKIWIYSNGYLSKSDRSFILDIFIYRFNIKEILRSRDFLARIIETIGESRVKSSRRDFLEKKNC